LVWLRRRLEIALARGSQTQIVMHWKEDHIYFYGSPAAVLAEQAILYCCGRLYLVFLPLTLLSRLIDRHQTFLHVCQ